jgi:hypothetical protein
MKNGGGDRSSLAAKTTTLMTNPQLMRIKMPRPKSEITSVAVTVSARLIPAHFAEWKRLGGVNWLRQHLRESIQKRKEQENERI